MKQCGVKKKTSSTFRTFVFVYFYFWAGRWAYSEALLESWRIHFFGILQKKKYSLNFLHYQTRLFVIDFF